MDHRLTAFSIFDHFPDLKLQPIQRLSEMGVLQAIEKIEELVKRSGSHFTPLF